MSLPVTDRLPHDESLKRLHRLLPNGAFENEWQRGRSLDFVSSIELALHDPT
jgi:hypothetical protein